MSYGISVFRLWCKFRTNCNPVSVREKPSSYGQDSIYSPQLVVFSVFDQFSDLDLRHNILIQLSLYQTKNYLGMFVSFVSYLKFSSYYIQKENILSADPHVHIEWEQIKEYSIICASYIRKTRKEVKSFFYGKYTALLITFFF